MCLPANRVLHDPMLKVQLKCLTGEYTRLYIENVNIVYVTLSISTRTE
jgi:hypothetical protein